MASTPDRLAWETALARYQRDHATLTARPYGRTATDHPDYGRLERGQGALLDVAAASLKALIETPAPNGAGLVTKLKIIMAEHGDEHGALKHVIADARELAVAAAGDALKETELEEVWSRRVTAGVRYSALPMGGEYVDADGHDPAEATEWAIMRDTEQIIISRMAKTARGAAIQLWAAVLSFMSSREEEAAVFRGDLDWLLADREKRDWSEQMALAALRSIESMWA
jgi:hypothetical protein